MPLVLQTTTDPGDSYWAPLAGGLEYWSEDAFGNLYPDADFNQDLGLPTNRVRFIFAGQTQLWDGIGTDPGAADERPGLMVVEGDINNSGRVRKAGGAAIVGGAVESTGVSVSRPQVWANGRQSAVLGVAIRDGTGAASVWAGSSTYSGGTNPNPSLTIGLASTASTGIANVGSQYGGIALAQAYAMGAGRAEADADTRGMVLGLCYADAEAAYLVAEQSAIAHGQSGGTKYSRIAATGIGALAQGLALGGSILAGENGSIASGRTNGYNSVIQSYAHGAIASGFAYGDSSKIYTATLADGALAMGYAATYCYILAGNDGAHAFGSATSSSQIYAFQKGSLAFGSAVGFDILSYGAGAIAHGLAVKGYIQATGAGSWAGGRTAGYNIEALAAGSFAFGYADTADIQATLANSFQMGPGTNNRTMSLQVGDASYGILLIGDGIASTRDGAIWLNAGNIYMRSGGVTKNVTTL
jgi:hypothetical protein